VSGREPYADFERDVPEHLREDAMQMMAEMTGGYGEHSCIHILDRDKLDAINVRAHGIIEIDGEEYTFQMEDGNWSGTVLLDWNSGREFEKHVPIRWTLQPSNDLINKAIEAGKGPFLIWKWDVMLKRPEIAAIPGKYAYDRHFAPGGKTEQHWKAAAAKHRFVIVSEERAEGTRKRLAEATEPLP